MRVIYPVHKNTKSIIPYPFGQYRWTALNKKQSRIRERMLSLFEMKVRGMLTDSFSNPGRDALHINFVQSDPLAAGNWLQDDIISSTIQTYGNTHMV